MNTGSGILGLIVLALDIWAIINHLHDIMARIVLQAVDYDCGYHPTVVPGPAVRSPWTGSSPTLWQVLPQVLPVTFGASRTRQNKPIPTSIITLQTR